MRIAVLDDYQQIASSFADWGALAPHEATFFHEPLGKDVAAMLKPFEVIVLMRERTPITAGLLEQLPALRLLVTTGMRNAAVDLEAARARGVVVCGTDVLSHPTVELTWALILALARGLLDEARSMSEGGWQRGIGADLSGATLGVLGLGRIGSAVARIGLAFGMRPIAWSENLTAQRASAVGAELVDRERLFRESDVLTIHLVLSARTRGLVGASELALLKPTAFLVNTSRGPVVDESALVAALQANALAGAALDVYDMEPLPRDHPLRKAPRTLLTPHIGYVTTDNYARFYPQVVEDIAAFLLDEPIRVL